MKYCYTCSIFYYRVSINCKVSLSFWSIIKPWFAAHFPFITLNPFGIDAARQAGVRSPLAELSIDKSTIRSLSRALGFPWWDKPAQPCLASRFPYGESISAERLKRVGQAEAWLIARGFSSVRVRSHGLAARIEVPIEQIRAVLTLADSEPLVEAFRALGFTSVNLDLEGLVSGKLNRR